MEELENKQNNSFLHLKSQRIQFFHEKNLDPQKKSLFALDHLLICFLLLYFLSIRSLMFHLYFNHNHRYKIFYNFESWHIL